MTQYRKPYLWEAFIPVISLAVFLVTALYKFHLEPHIPLVFGCVIASMMALKLGYTWTDIRLSILESVYRAVEAIVIIHIVGMLIGTWISSGTIPAMVYYGLDLIEPQIFLVTGCIICAIVSFATGSSWTSSGTVGVALMGIASGLGVNPALSAGMVVSGAYFGDKLSPFSDSSNIAAATAETNLYSHIGAMMYTTLPSFFIALVLYGIVGIQSIHGEFDTARVELIQHTLQNEFIIAPIVMIPALFILLAAIKKIHPIPSLLFGALLGGIWSIIFQHRSLKDVFLVLHFGFQSHTGVNVVDTLLSRGGFDSMMWTISLIIFALAFGGIMEKTRFTEVLLEGIIGKVQSVTGLIGTTIFTSIISDFILTDQYLSIIVPGRAYAFLYDQMHLDRRTLSRTLEDGATLWSPMCPWNGCGAYQAATLGVATFTYLPFAFFNLINPLVAIFMAYMGWGLFYNKNILEEIAEKEGLDL
ncbi:Na+/H+ antiporter NhaC [Clostridiaceae bacterium 35-E11]